MSELKPRFDAESFCAGVKEGRAEMLKIFQQQIDAAIHSRPVQIIIPKESVFIAPTVTDEEIEKEFNAWFGKQKYSLGNIPNWTQQDEMARAWKACAKWLRERLTQ